MAESKFCLIFIEEVDQEIEAGERDKINGIEDLHLIRNVVRLLIVKIKT
jgi:hypothetical protein